MTSNPYPRWRYFPAFQRPPAWVRELTGIFTTNRATIDSMVEHAIRMESNAVLNVLADDLENKMGFTSSAGRIGSERSRARYSSVTKVPT